MLTLDHLLILLKNQPEKIDFDEVMLLIDSLYDITPTAFHNGTVYNTAEENQGSCKLFAFAQEHKFSAKQTLDCFGQHYRNVLKNPDGTDHQNIRQFIAYGWEGVRFEGETPSLSMRK
ncbi:MAG: HopJ type III effector protein [Gammaproteobacteria bacterium]